MSKTGRRSASGDDSDDALERVALTVTRRSWAARREEAPKPTAAGVHNSSTSSSSDTQAVGGLTATTLTSTPLHSTAVCATPLTSDSQTQQQRKRQSREVSIDLVWGEEGAEHDVTPSTVLTRAPRPMSWGDASSPAAVRRRLSLHEVGRRSGTVATTVAVGATQQTPSPMAARVSIPVVTPTPASHMRPFLLQPTDPPTESRGLSVRPGYTLPSPSTPLWAALEEEVGEADGSLHENNDDDVARLSLARRPLSFAQHAPPVVLSATDTVEVAPSLTPHSQRRLELSQRQMKADAWAEQTRRFFDLIDQRPLLTVTVDEAH
ncbi:hypothetical protein DQ04_02531050 [Trypanosoma grayi]|uniref:hypothetical protein n=1 Tax=Trypanosoma grayi TaxID=71804 RepID=UPI0004F45FA2|nr:hypothetical protein DQ04_02531050 [Trypanosoma grayi]KEG11529.1 hypothetical protein DQ04_02531050 [Trypanosoma grayi]